MMLDTIFGNGTERKHKQDELRNMMSQARQERAALRTLLEQASASSEKLARTSQALDELGAKTDAMMRKVDKLAGAAAGNDELRAQRFEQLEARVGDLLAQVAEIKHASSAASAPEDTQRQHRLAMDELNARTSEAQASLESQRASAVQEVQIKLESLAQLQEFGKDAEKRLAALNALAEHVSHKAKALETQRHTVEHAVVEATRLNEMVWSMDAQIAKLADGRDQLQRTEEAVARMEQLARTTAQELGSATAARAQFQRESTQFEEQGRKLSEYMRSTIERLSVEKTEFDAFDQRLKSLSVAVADTETRVQGVLAKDEAMTAIQLKAETLGKAFVVLTAEAEALAHRQAGLDTLAEQLGQVEALGKRTSAQQQGLMQSQQDLEAVRRDMAEFHAAHAEATQLRDKLGLDRSALESFAERTTTMLSRLPAIEAQLDSVLGKMALVDEGSKSAARLGETVAELDTQLTRVAARQLFVEKLEERLNGLYLLSAEVDGRLTEQLVRRAEVEGLKNQCDTLGTQIVDAQQKLDGVAALQGRLQPMAAQVSTLMQTLESSQTALQALHKDEAAVQDQQARLGELVEQGRQQAAQTAERLRQVQAVSDDLGRVTSLKDELLAELTRVQARQRDTVSQIDVADDQLKRAESMVKQLEQRRSQLLQTEKTIAAFEGRLGELDRGTEAVEQKIKSLADREVLVQAVKTEVDNIRQISSRSRADLQFVSDQRSDVTELRAKVEDLMGRVEDTDGKIASIESRRKMVEEVQSRATAITGMLGDINLNLEMLSEQRAVIDHVGEKLARLDFTVQEAQNTLRALQREREVAERIEQGIKALRTRSGGATP